MNSILKAWLDSKGRGAAAQLAKDSGLSKSYISELANSKGNSGMRLTAHTAKALQKGTGIPATVWLGLEPLKKTEAA